MLTITSSRLVLPILSILSTINAQCVSTESQPNPIYKQYPTQTTGALNGTIAILPIPYSLARSIVPSQYPILEKSIKHQLPWFPQGLYPALLQIQFDHDVGVDGVPLLADFQRTSISFPFIDRLLDNYTNMMYNLNIAVTSTNTLAISGIQAYGETAIPAVFDPPCDAYAYVDEDCPEDKARRTYLDIYQAPKYDNSTPIFTSLFSELQKWEVSPYSLEFWKNVTNQPDFFAGEMCDNFVRLFNTTSNEGVYAPKDVRGKVVVKEPLFTPNEVFDGVYGLKVANGFIEHNYVQCETLKGYTASGSGD